MDTEPSAVAVMRSVLFVPSTVERFVERAPQVGADSVCLDLEDSIPPAEKARARTMAAEAIERMPRTGYVTLVRVNGLATGLLEEDLRAVVRPGLDGIVLPKADSAQTVRRAEELIAALERERGLEAGEVGIIPLIETALGVVNSYEVCSASPRVVAGSFGAEDLATDMRIRRTRGGKEIEWPRAQIAVSCHAAGLIPIDTPEPDYTDLEYLEQETSFARSLGYRGKYCIHPAQVEVVNRVFSPSQEEIEEAKTIVELLEREGIAKGRAAIPVNGRMIDTPIYWRARRLVQWAEAAGLAAKE